MAVTLQDVEESLRALASERSSVAGQAYQPAVGAEATHDVDIVTRPSAGSPAPAGVTLADVEASLAAPEKPLLRFIGTPDQWKAGLPVLRNLPGFEVLDVLPASAQEATVEAIPGVAKTAAGIAMSPATSMGGAAVGSVAGPLGAVAGEMLGSYAGRRINVALGLEEPGTAGDVVSVGGPLATRAVSLGMRYARGLRPQAADDVLDLAERHGVRTSYGDVTQSPTARRAEVALESVPVVGASRFRAAQQADVRAAAETVEAATQQALRDVPYRGLQEVQAAANQGSKQAQRVLDDIANAGDEWTQIVQASGNLKAWRAKHVAEQLYDRVETLARNAGPLPIGNTLDVLDTALQAADTALLPDPQLRTLLTTLRDRLTDPHAQLGFSNLRQLRSDLGDLVSDYYQGTNAMTGAKGVGALTQVRSAVERDMETFALQSGTPELATAWRRADRFYQQQVVPFKDRELAKALTDTHPDEVYKKFIQRGKGDRAQQFYSALDPKGKAAVRYGMVEEALDAATQPTTGAFSPAKFAQSLERIQDAREVFFRGQDRWELDGFTRLMRHVERAGQYAENPPTGQRLMQLLIVGGAGAGAVMNPQVVAGGGAASLGLTWLLTSPRGRNLLLASDLTPGAPSMERVAATILREGGRVVTSSPGQPSRFCPWSRSLLAGDALSHELNLRIIP